MTYIAIHCTKESAEIWTDTASYLIGGTGFRPTSKVHLIPHLQAAVTANGGGAFTGPAKIIVTQQTSLVRDFDELVDSVRPVFQELWEDTHAVDKYDLWANAFVVGYSPAADTFQGWKYSSITDFEPELIEGVMVAPALFGSKQDREGLEVLAEQLGDPVDDEQAAIAAKIMAEAPDWPPLQPPTDMAGWVALAETARNQRALMGPWGRVWVAGELQRTILDRELVATMKMYDFNDTGAELVQLVEGSFHPVAQISPCYCRSGATALDCCMAAYLDQPCVCDSEALFRDCCMVVDRDSVPMRLWTAPKIPADGHTGPGPSPCQEGTDPVTVGSC